MITNEWTIEIEKLRKQNADLKANSKRMHELVIELVSEDNLGLDCVSYDLEQHNDLMKSMEE